MSKAIKKQRKQSVVVNLEDSSSEEGDVYTAEVNYENTTMFRRLFFSWAEPVLERAEMCGKLTL
jgi:hypothetical protein